MCSEWYLCLTVSLLLEGERHDIIYSLISLCSWSDGWKLVVQSAHRRPTCRTAITNVFTVSLNLQRLVHVRLLTGRLSWSELWYLYHRTLSQMKVHRLTGRTLRIIMVWKLCELIKSSFIVTGEKSRRLPVNENIEVVDSKNLFYYSVQSQHRVLS